MQGAGSLPLGYLASERHLRLQDVTRIKRLSLRRHRGGLGEREFSGRLGGFTERIMCISVIVIISFKYLNAPI